MDVATNLLGIVIYLVIILSMTFLLLLSFYQLFLVISYRRLRGEDPAPESSYAPENLPSVTIQLPVYNEGPMADQVLRYAAALDYPADKLQIQYIDDSDDGITTELAKRVIEELRSSHPGIDFQYVRREDREGFKAGALKLGMETATGEFLAVFDADFQIPTDYLQRTIHYFNDPSVGAVQARWAYTNDNQSLFTRLQANKLDAHQMFEQTARERMGFVPIFHGTAGVWRREALDAADGWNCISEVEDVEISIRSAIKDWRMVYLDHYRILSELPDNVNAFLRQQMRWRRGWMRIVRHYSSTIIRSSLPWPQRIDLLVRIHFTWGPVLGIIATLGVLPCFMLAAKFGVVYPTIAIYSLSLITGLVLRHLETRTLDEDPQKRVDLDVHPVLKFLPLSYMLFSLGMLWPLCQATLEGFGKEQVWEVTPKTGTTPGSAGHAAADRKKLPLYVYGTLGLGLISAILAVLSMLSLNILPTVFYGLLAVGCGLNGVMLLQFFGYETRLAAPVTRALVE